MSNFIDLKDLSRDQLLDLMSLSLKLKKEAHPKFMADKQVVLIFEKHLFCVFSYASQYGRQVDHQAIGGGHEVDTVRILTVDCTVRDLEPGVARPARGAAP